MDSHKHIHDSSVDISIDHSVSIGNVVKKCLSTNSLPQIQPLELKSTIPMPTREKIGETHADGSYRPTHEQAFSVYDVHLETAKALLTALSQPSSETVDRALQQDLMKLKIIPEHYQLVMLAYQWTRQHVWNNITPEMFNNTYLYRDSPEVPYVLGEHQEGVIGSTYRLIPIPLWFFNNGQKLSSIIEDLNRVAPAAFYLPWPCTIDAEQHQHQHQRVFTLPLKYLVLSAGPWRSLPYTVQPMVQMVPGTDGVMSIRRVVEVQWTTSVSSDRFNKWHLSYMPRHWSSVFIKYSLSSQVDDGLTMTASSADTLPLKYSYYMDSPPTKQKHCTGRVITMEFTSLTTVADLVGFIQRVIAPAQLTEEEELALAKLRGSISPTQEGNNREHCERARRVASHYLQWARDVSKRYGADLPLVSIPMDAYLDADGEVIKSNPRFDGSTNNCFPSPVFGFFESHTPFSLMSAVLPVFEASGSDFKKIRLHYQSPESKYSPTRNSIVTRVLSRDSTVHSDVEERPERDGDDAITFLTQNARLTQQDAVLAVPNFTGTGCGGESLYCVFDGNGSDEAAYLCREQIAPRLAALLADKGATAVDELDSDGWTGLFNELFMQLDQAIFDLGLTRWTGCTATVVYKRAGKGLIVANVGDSEAWLLFDQVQALPASLYGLLTRPNPVCLTTQHGTVGGCDQAEKDRVVAAGGEIRDGYVSLKESTPYINDEVRRRMMTLPQYQRKRRLNMTRCLGAFQLAPAVIATPAVTVYRGMGHSGRLVVASDGVWSAVLGSDLELLLSGVNLEDVPEVIMDQLVAFKREHGDNVGMVVVDFK
eukprot:gnl/Dysnectes_brevis/4122_a5429_907.p1 GENE.gnl/Dysnectes_brevis/4122_a5429_907~~gnl/Dysnectes_brevis/4122_a5429_907.p1  ORF type:complete len:821 (+),score=113.21 gnl/Dysnectes_brevis/4122_a5429_907:110-2572(+)